MCSFKGVSKVNFYNNNKNKYFLELDPKMFDEVNEASKKIFIYIYFYLTTLEIAKLDLHNQYSRETMH